MPQPKRKQTKHPKKPSNKSKGKKPSNKQGKKGQKNRKKKASTSLYDPRTTLVGKKLKKFVQSQVRQQIRPQVAAEKSRLSSIQDLLANQTGQLAGLGGQASANISEYYKGLANSTAQSLINQQALGGRLRGEVGAAGAQAQERIGAAAGATTAGLDASGEVRRAGPSSAREELQKLIAEQQGMAARESSTLGVAASGRASDWESALRMAGQAGQMRGGEQLSDTQREVLNRITDLQNQYAPDIRESIANIAQIKGSKGDVRRGILGETIERERQYGLSKGALGIDRKSLKAEQSGATGQVALAKQYAKNKRAEQKRSLKNQLKVAEQQADNKRAEQIRSKLNQLAVAEKQAKNKAAEQRRSKGLISGASGSGGNKLEDYDRTDRQRAMSYVRTSGSTAFIKRNKQKLIDELNRRYGINPVLGRWAIKKYLSSKGGKESGTGQTLNAVLNR